MSSKSEAIRISRQHVEYCALVDAFKATYGLDPLSGVTDYFICPGRGEAGAALSEVRAAHSRMMQAIA